MPETRVGALWLQSAVAMLASAVAPATPRSHSHRTQGDTMAHDLSKDQIATLLDKLSADKAFHAAFGKDPAAALKSIGLPTTLAACMSGKQLASMDAISGSRSAITTLFADSKTLALNVHNLAAR